MKRILVVEDEPDIMLTLSVNLELEGFDVLEATTGEEALQVLGREVPDLVVLDIRLPGIDGWAVLEELRGGSRLRGIPVVVLSAHATGDSAKKALGMGAHAYVTKPFLPDELTRTIHLALEPA